MDIRIVTVFCLCDALLKAFNHQPDPQVRMSGAEIMTTALVVTLFFGANFETARDFLRTHGYIPNTCSQKAGLIDGFTELNPCSSLCSTSWARASCNSISRNATP